MSIELGEAFAALGELNGSVEVLAKARQILAGRCETIGHALDELELLVKALERHDMGSAVQFDLAELRGYRYHAGIVFAAFVHGHGQEVARGGRYDHVARAFGRARPATGFSTDLRMLATLGKQPSVPNLPSAIFAPYDAGTALRACIRRLRANGERVIEGLPDQIGAAAELMCERELKLIAGEWTVTDAVIARDGEEETVG